MTDYSKITALYRQIAREQGVDKSVVRRSVKRGMAAMKKYLKKVL